MDLTRRAHDLIRNHFDGFNGKLAIDATCGNGFDTVFLASLGFNEVIAFDIQKHAITNTQERLNELRLDNVRLVNESHVNIAKHIEQPADCVMFNFGYMPNLTAGGTTNKRITTHTDTSLSAVNTSLERLSPSGLISLMCYPGHPQGAEETIAIQKWLTEINPIYNVVTHLAKSPKTTAPILYTIAQTTKQTLRKSHD